jgi:hypothetical protein
MPVDDAVRSAAAALGRRGGLARAARMSAEDRSETARHAAIVRWGGGHIAKPKSSYGRFREYRGLPRATVEILDCLGR